MKSLEQLVAEAEARPFQGWDFRYLGGRYLEGGNSWNFREVLLNVLDRARAQA